MMAYLKGLVSAFAAALLMIVGIQAHAQAPVASPARTAAPAAATPGAKSPAEAGYNIGADDVIEVDVLGQPEFKTRARVKSDGTLQLPFLGTVNVAGQNSIVLADSIATRLRAGGFYSRPIVNVEIVSYASRYVVVLGEVMTPGLQPVDRGYRVSEIIARSGGIKPTGADYVIVNREKGGELKLPFEKLAKGSDTDDPYVMPGDKVFVPEAELFYIYGQVNAPGVYPLKDGTNLRKAIARGGGLTPSGSEKRVKVYRNGNPQKVDLERIVQPGDVIVVGERLF